MWFVYEIIILINERNTSVVVVVKRAIYLVNKSSLLYVLSILLGRACYAWYFKCDCLFSMLCRLICRVKNAVYLRSSKVVNVSSVVIKKEKKRKKSRLLHCLVFSFFDDKKKNFKKSEREREKLTLDQNKMSRRQEILHNNILKSLNLKFKLKSTIPTWFGSQHEMIANTSIMDLHELFVNFKRLKLSILPWAFLPSSYDFKYAKKLLCQHLIHSLSFFISMKDEVSSYIIKTPRNKKYQFDHLCQ